MAARDRFRRSVLWETVEKLISSTKTDCIFLQTGSGAGDTRSGCRHDEEAGSRSNGPTPKRFRPGRQYLKYACELLERQAFGRTVTLREVLEMAARRLSAGDHYVGDAATEITVMLRQVAEKVSIAEARTQILKPIAVLRDRVGR